ncbi:flagellar hook-length control protein FliK [Microvirga sp. GCM10011540]|uniref:flagellar hook-length control protein FliK n=1 Tax=Microvirga sp. GCM10011540 TaxID=3317338 RepID=UPI00360B9947
MNNLDSLFQSISRRAEGQTLKPQPHPAEDGGLLKGSAAMPAFDALLRKMSGKGDGEQVQSRTPLVGGNALLTAREVPLEQVQEGQGEEPITSADQEISIPATTDPTMLVSNMSLPVQPAAQQPASSQRSSAVPQPTQAQLSPTELLAMIQLPTEEMGKDNVPDLTSRSARKVMVIHQETHFKPVLANELPKTEKSAISSPKQPAAQNLPPIEMSPTALPANEVEQIDGFDEPAEAFQKAQARSAQATSPNVDKAVDPELNLSNAVAQRIMSIVDAEAKRVPLEYSSSAGRSEAAAPMSITRPSDGVLRMLDIQLHPAELGVVTVKMRLSGDRLEMELHASNDETAELLKKDSEKLSSLLRTSGYRPDVVTVHATGSDMPQQDGMFGQRQSSNSYAGSFPGGSQGGDTGANGQSRRDADGFGGSNRTGRENGNEEVPAANRSTGSLYL